MPSVLRVVSYNIHKGVRGPGPARRLEIHNLRQAIARLYANLVCLQELRQRNLREEQFFARWPSQGEADFSARQGHTAVYRSNAITRHGEHGNALFSRWPVLAHQHADMSGHRFEQRGLLHSEVELRGQRIHVLVLHLGLMRGGCMRQLQQVWDYVRRAITADAPVMVAGDFNEWNASVRKVQVGVGLEAATHRPMPTFPSALPLLAPDPICSHGPQCLRQYVPRGPLGARMSDDLPIAAKFVLPGQPLP